MEILNRYGRLNIQGNVINVLFMCLLFLYSLLVMPDASLNPLGEKFLVSPDSATYYTIISNPWKCTDQLGAARRSPGYALFLYPFFWGSRDTIDTIQRFNATSLKNFKYWWGASINNMYNLYKQKNVLEIFNRIAYVQSFIMAAAIVLIYIALSQYFPYTVSFFSIILAIFFLPLENPYCILSESLAQPLSLVSFSLLLIYYKSKKFIYLYAGCLICSICFLIRPSCIFLTLIFFSCLTYFLIKNSFRYFIKFFISFLLLISVSSGYILYLSIPYGKIIFGTLSYHTYSALAFYFLNEDDIKSMPTERSKRLGNIFLTNKEAIISHIEKYDPNFRHRRQKDSLPKAFTYISEGYAFHGRTFLDDKLKEDSEFNRLTLLERTRIFDEMKRGIYKNHLMQLLRIRLSNFLSAFDFFNDYRTTRLTNIIGYKLSIIGYGILSIAVALANSRRFPVIILFSSHIFSVAVCACSYIIIPRYVRFTETLLLISFLLSLYIIASKSFNKVIHARIYNQA